MLSFFNSKRKQKQAKSGPVRADFLRQIVFSWVGNFHNALRDDFRLLDNLQNYSVDELTARGRVERFSGNVEGIRQQVISCSYGVTKSEQTVLMAHLQKAAIEAQFVVIKERLGSVKNGDPSELKAQAANLSDQLAASCFSLARLYGGSDYAHNFYYQTTHDVDFATRSTRYYHQAITYKCQGADKPWSEQQLMSLAVHFQEMAERYAPVHANKASHAISSSISAIACLQAALGSASDDEHKVKICLELAERYLDLAKKYKLSKDHNDQHIRDALFFANFYIADDHSPESIKLRMRVSFLSTKYHELLHSDPLRKVQRSLRIRFNFNKFIRSLLALNVEANAIAANDKRERAPDFYQEYLCALLATKNTLYLRKLYVKLMARQKNFSDVLALMIDKCASNEDYSHATIIAGLEALPARFLESLGKVLLDRGIDVTQLESQVKLKRFSERDQGRYRKIIDTLLLDIASKKLVFLMSTAPDPETVKVEVQPAC